jgi:N-acetylmuramoyl-L-alanine amidase
MLPPFLTSPLFVLIVAVLLCWLIAITVVRRRVRQSFFKTALPVIRKDSPNHDDRDGNAVSVLVLHFTGMGTLQGAVSWLCDPKSKVSSHYVVGENGMSEIYQLVDEDQTAWHAGVSFWAGHRNVNNISIGIEISNNGEQPFPQAQMDAVIALSKDIIVRNGIDAHHVVAHSDVAIPPGRKPDPGPYFDWKRLAQEGIGMWPVPEKQDYDLSKSWGEDEFRAALTRFGYTPTGEFENILEVFQRHYQPEVFFTDKGNLRKVNPEASARLACLLRMLRG